MTATPKKCIGCKVAEAVDNGFCQECADEIRMDNAHLYRERE